MNPLDRATALRPFMITPDSYQILRKLYFGSQPKDSKEWCELRRKHLIYLSDSTCEMVLTTAGKAVYEAATIALEEAEEALISRNHGIRAPVFTIAQLAALALFLAAIALSGIYKKTLDAATVTYNTVTEPKCNGTSKSLRKNQHEQPYNPDSTRSPKGASGGAESGRLEHL